MSAPLLLLTLAVASGGYVRARVDESVPDSHCLWWQDGDLPITQSTRDVPTMANGGETTFSAVTGSYGSWQTVSNSCGNFAFQETAQTPSDQVGYDPSANDNTNLVVFRKVLCTSAAPPGAGCFQNGGCNNAYHCWEYGATVIGLTTTTFSRESGRIFDADMELNSANFQFTTSDLVVKTDLRNTVTHEMGHFLGLAHSPDLGSTMFAKAPEGETSKRSLDADSQQFVCDAYPKGRPSQDCLIVSASNQLGPAQGCSSLPGTPGLAGLGLWSLLRARRRSPSLKNAIP